MEKKKMIKTFLVFGFLFLLPLISSQGMIIEDIVEFKNVTANYFNGGVFSGDGSGLTGIIASSVAWNRSSSNVYLSMSTDEVGIGTSSPTQKLDVNGSSRFGNSTDFASFSSSGVLSFNGTGVYQIRGNSYAFQYDLFPNAGLYFNQDDAGLEFRDLSANPIMHLNVNSGNMGFGTINPQQKVHVVESSGDSGYRLETEGGSTGVFDLLTTEDGEFKIYDVKNTADRIIIDSSGNFRIPKTHSIIAGTSTNAESITITHDGNNGIIDNTKGPWYFRQRVNRDIIFQTAPSGLETAMRIDGLTTYTSLGDIANPATRLHLLGNSGITYSIVSGGSDGDINLLNVDVTGSPKLKWNESLDNFELNKGFKINGDANITSTTFTQIIQLESSSLGACNSTYEGQIKYNGTSFYGCDSLNWSSFI